jgi:plasmid stabilization system protein ParE
MRLRYTKRAAQQIDKSLSYIAEQSPQGAAHVRERLFAAVTLLQYRPYAGRATSRAGIRRFSLLPYPYFIDYRIVGDDLIVMRSPCRPEIQREIMIYGQRPPARIRGRPGAQHECVNARP